MDFVEFLQREKIAEINSNPSERELLEAKHGQVWDTKQLCEDFDVEGFMAPYVAVRKKDTGERGSLEFQHMPRFYYGFDPTGG